MYTICTVGSVKLEMNHKLTFMNCGEEKEVSRVLTRPPE